MKTDRNSGAIVCGHVARGIQPIRRAVRDLPIAPEDSGWQFLCDAGESEDAERAQIWAVAHVLEEHPALVQWIDCDPGISLILGNDGIWQRLS
jgi:hypothetical protein